MPKSTPSRPSLPRCSPQSVRRRSSSRAVPPACSTKALPRPPSEVFDLGVPVLGICYGQQVMMEILGGRVERGTGTAEFGRAYITASAATELLEGWFLAEKEQVWMSHGDHVAALAPGFEVYATSPGCAFRRHARSLDRRLLRGPVSPRAFAPTPMGCRRPSTRTPRGRMRASPARLDHGVLSERAIQKIDAGRRPAGRSSARYSRRRPTARSRRWLIHASHSATSSPASFVDHGASARKARPTRS